MADDIWEGRWHRVKGNLREQWGKISDDELEQAKGNAEQVVGLLQERYGLTKAQAEKELDKTRASAA